MFDKRMQGFVLIALMLTVAAASIPITKAPESAHAYFTATITPTVVICDSTETYTITICNDLSTPGTTPQYLIGSVAILIPSGFTGILITGISYLLGKEWLYTTDSTHILLHASNGESTKLAPGDCVSVTFSATAPTPASSPQTYEWTTTAYVATDWTSSTATIICPDQPEVTVVCPGTVTVTQTDTVTQSATETQTDTVTQSATETQTATVTDTVTTTTTEIGLITAVSNIYVFVGAPAPAINKPRGVAQANWIDSSAGAVMVGALGGANLYYDTDSVTVNQAGLQAGKPIPEGVFVTSGGPLVNGVASYYEANRASEGAPVYFFFTGTNMQMRKSSDNSVLSSLPISGAGAVGPQLDNFLIEIYTDARGDTVMTIYGYGGRGTLAGALYLKNEVLPQLPSDIASVTGPYYLIVKWQDLNNNSAPEVTDSFTVLANSFPYTFPNLP